MLIQAALANESLYNCAYVLGTCCKRAHQSDSWAGVWATLVFVPWYSGEVSHSLNDNFAPPMQNSPPPQAEPAVSKDYSFAKSYDSNDRDEDDEEIDSADEVAPEAEDDAVAAEARGAEANATEDNELAIINPSQERAIVATRKAGVPHISPDPRMQTRRCIPIQDTQLDSLYPRETFPIYTGAVRHGPEFDLEVYRQKLCFFANSPYASARTADDLRFWTAE